MESINGHVYIVLLCGKDYISRKCEIFSSKTLTEFEISIAEYSTESILQPDIISIHSQYAYYAHVGSVIIMGSLNFFATCMKKFHRAAFIAYKNLLSRNEKDTIS